MDEFQLRRRGIGFLLGQQILHLPADQAAAARGIGQLADQRVGKRRLGGVGGGQECEGMGQKGVAREQGRGFVEGLVRGRAAAAEIVVIQARQIVMDQRIRVDALEGDRGRQGGLGGGAVAVGGGEHQDGSQPFAARFETIAHRGVQARRAGVGGGHVPGEALLDAGNVTFEFGGKVHHFGGGRNWSR